MAHEAAFEAATAVETAVRMEVLAIERKLRRLARERTDAEAAMTLHTKLEHQLHALPAAQRASADAALQRVQSQLQEHAAAQAERHREALTLVARIGQLQRRIAGSDGEDGCLCQTPLGTSVSATGVS